MQEKFSMGIDKIEKVQAVQRKGDEMKQRLAWNSGKSYRQANQLISVLSHTLLAMGTPLFHAKRSLISPLFLCNKKGWWLSQLTLIKTTARCYRCRS